ncbi:MAG: hypothetical protein K8R11_07630, partial [Methanococcoides sp.]|nr:hypothetical protein [Methanococcoides sp.]
SKVFFDLFLKVEKTDMFLTKTNKMVEAAGVELGPPHFPQIVVCRAFLLIFSQLNPFLQSSINKISSIIPSKIKIFYTKFTPRIKSKTT